MNARVNARRICVAVLAALVASPAVGAEVHPMIAGDSAPVSGLLIEEARYTKFLKAEQGVKELGQRLAFQVKYCEASEGFYKAEIKRVTQPVRWYQDSAFNRCVGFGLGIVATSLAVWGATKVTAR